MISRKRICAILFIMALSGILNAGFSQIFVLYNPMVIRVADIIDTYVCEGGNDWIN